MGNINKGYSMPNNNEALEASPSGGFKPDTSRGTQSTCKPIGSDVMISYSHADDAFMKRLKARLNKEKITYWVDLEGLKAGTNFITRIGQAVLEAKILLPMISTTYMESKYCRDELALGYLSSKPIVAIGLQTMDELDPVMDTGVRLQMARQDWFDVQNGDIEACFDKVISRIREIIRTSNEGKRNEDEEEGEDKREFWDKNFKDVSRISWESFLNAFNAEYEEEMIKNFGEKEEMKKKVVATMKRELDVSVNEDCVLKGVYINFTTKNSDLWASLKRQMAEDIATDEVLGMSSSVRVDFIEYLGKCDSKRIVEALIDLLERGETDSQVTAAISLARTGVNSERVINKLMTCLDSKDRLVRQSGCLALGHLRAKESVPKLIELWRNDVIADVRQASEISLERIGGEEAMNAIEVTNVLSAEIRQLTQEKDESSKKV